MPNPRNRMEDAAQNLLTIVLQKGSRLELPWRRISRIRRPLDNVVQIFCARSVVLIEGGNLEQFYEALLDRSIETVIEGYPVPSYPLRPFISFIAVITSGEFAAQERVITGACEKV